jgi:predicted transport protein
MTLPIEEIIKMRENAIQDLLKEKQTILDQLEKVQHRIVEIDEALNRLGYIDAASTRPRRKGKSQPSPKVVEYSEETLLLGKQPEVISLYHSLAEKIMELGTDIELSFAQKYAAFSTIRHFCEIVAWVSKLTVYLAIPIDRLGDPKNICEDCSKIGRWPSGQTRFQLMGPPEIDYAIGLIKQSYLYINSSGE